MESRREEVAMNDDRCVVKRKDGERGAGLILEDGNWTARKGEARYNESK